MKLDLVNKQAGQWGFFALVRATREDKEPKDECIVQEVSVETTITSCLGGHPKPANGGHLKTGQR